MTTPPKSALPVWSISSSGYICRDGEWTRCRLEFVYDEARQLAAQANSAAELHAALAKALLRLEHLGSEETGPCEVTAQAREALAKGAK